MALKQVRSVSADAQPHWVGDGFPVSSLFTYQNSAEFDPFLLLDYAEPYEFAPASAVRGVGEHPHRGFETVTIVYQGELEHKDSAGNRGSIGPGDVQWMTAAGGVVHEEFHSERFTRTGGTFEVVQLWVNLPASEKTAKPRYQGILNQQIPTVTLPAGAGSVRVIAGEFDGTQGPAKTVTPVRLWDLQLAKGAQVKLPTPAGFTTVLVVQRGAVNLSGGRSARSVSLVVFERDRDEIELDATEATRALLLCGQPIGEPVVAHGPFVMNKPEEIRQAFLDYQSGQMGRIG
jgi:redox-sensitive bicupin YhaK (pirin superfamily)